MNKTGKELEELIAAIEERLLPQGFKVEPRQKVFNDSGEQIAELDILITGPLGSSTVSWLIECRDRPSKGPAPACWIEQLVGRRERFLLDKVFAVSTTGFSKAAQDFAQSKNIVLRTVTGIADIKSDFKIQGVLYFFELMEFAGPVDLDTADPADKRTRDIRNPMLKRPEELEFQHFPVFVFRNPQHLHSIDESAGLVLFKYDEWLDLLAGDEQFRAHNLRAPLRIQRFERTSKALLATVYAEDERVICLEGQFEADSPKGKVKSRVRVFEKPDGTQSVQFFYDELPDGYFPDSLAVFGVNISSRQ